jgi:hypothetical protein
MGEFPPFVPVMDGYENRGLRLDGKMDLRPETFELPESGDKDIPAKSETVVLRHLGRVKGAGT